MKEADVKKLFLAMAVANGHPDPEAYAAKAVEAWVNPPKPAKAEKEGD